MKGNTIPNTVIIHCAIAFQITTLCSSFSKLADVKEKYSRARYVLKWLLSFVRANFYMSLQLEKEPGIKKKQLPNVLFFHSSFRKIEFSLL